MKNLLESFAVVLVGILSLAIVFLIVQYNLIEDDNLVEEIAVIVPQKKVTRKENVKSYLDSLEGYGDDRDVKVDATKESTLNKVVVKSELQKDDIDEVIDDKAKTSYMQNLENYAKKAEKEKLDTVKNPEHVPEKDISAEPEKLPQDEIVDEIGMAIEAALDDL